MWATALYTLGSLIPERYVLIGASQRSALKKFFATNPYPRKATVCQLATQLGLTESKVRNWFQNQRNKVAKDNPRTISNG